MMLPVCVGGLPSLSCRAMGVCKSPIARGYASRVSRSSRWIARGEPETVTAVLNDESTTAKIGDESQPSLLQPHSQQQPHGQQQLQPELQSQRSDIAASTAAVGMQGLPLKWRPLQEIANPGLVA